VGDVERALVSRPGIIATESAAKSNNSFFLIHKQLRLQDTTGQEGLAKATVFMVFI
jgi:hypothetical protein